MQYAWLPAETRTVVGPGFGGQPPWRWSRLTASSHPANDATMQTRVRGRIDSREPSMHVRGRRQVAARGRVHHHREGVSFEPNESPSLLRVGRYVVGEPFASGGMGTVHLGRVV